MTPFGNIVDSLMKNEYAKDWNAAIEVAAKQAEIYMDETVPTEIRKLKLLDQEGKLSVNSI